MILRTLLELAYVKERVICDNRDLRDQLIDQDEEYLGRLIDQESQ